MRARAQRASVLVTLVLSADDRAADGALDPRHDAAPAGERARRDSDGCPRRRSCGATKVPYPLYATVDKEVPPADGVLVLAMIPHPYHLHRRFVLASPLEQAAIDYRIDRDRR